MQAGPSSVRTLGRSRPMPGQCWLSPQDGAGGYSFLSFFYLVIISHVISYVMSCYKSCHFGCFLEALSVVW